MFTATGIRGIKRSTAMIFSDHELNISRLLQCPVDKVWEAWCIAEHLEKWWTPAPVKTKVAKLDLLPGGAFDTIIKTPDGNSHLAKGTFLNVVDHRLIVFTDALHEGWVPSGAGFMTVFVTLTDMGVKTQYDVRVAHKSDEDMQRHVNMGFNEGWNITINQLEKLAKSL